MYIAAAVADDLELQDVFRSGGNFHSTIAKKVFGLSCPVEDVVSKFGMLRQAAKAVSFGILYGASATKIADTVNKEMMQAAKDKGEPFRKSDLMSVRDAQNVINDYFGTFWKLKEWIAETQQFIKANAYVYSPLGRKRRLPNVRSDNRGVQGHEVRSGLNFIIQSVASDINLLGAIDTNAFIKREQMKTRIFALVHDSVLAEVPDDEIEQYQEVLQHYIQTDRGVSISGSPVGCDFEIGNDYALAQDKETGLFYSKFEKLYGSELQELGID